MRDGRDGAVGAAPEPGDPDIGDVPGAGAGREATRGQVAPAHQPERVLQLVGAAKARRDPDLGGAFDGPIVPPHVAANRS